MKRIRAWRRPGASGVLYAGDALEVLSSLPARSADIVFLDPPFNLGKVYSSRRPRLDHRSPNDYGRWLSTVLAEAARVVAEGGSLFLYHLPQWALRAGTQLVSELELRHWIAIAMKNGFARGRRLYPAHYALLYFTRGMPRVFTRPKLSPARCRHCDGLVKDYGGYRGIVEAQGLNLSDVWDDLSPVRHASKKRRPANELPSQITDRVVAIAGQIDGTFVDPFAGSGGSLISAIKVGMRFVASDLLRENCDLIASRVDQFKAAVRKPV